MSNPICKSTVSESPRGGRVRLQKYLRRFGRIVAYVFAGSVCFLTAGLIPVNNDFQPSASGVEIFVTSNPVHADFVLPLRTETVNWRDYFPESCFVGDTAAATHVAIGWGDRGFFLETPTWDDLTVGNTANALLWPSDSCLHVTMKTRPETGAQTRSVKISQAQYRQLVEFVLLKFRSNGDSLRQLPDARYGNNDAFFEAVGSYHCMNTCNSWVGKGLAHSGVRVGWLTPLPRTVFLYLPNEADINAK